MKKQYLDVLKKCTVLLVDDNESLRSKFRDTLFGYVDNVIEASNGEEALELYNSENPNIIITDVKMPVMDGLALTTLIRKLNSEIPIVIISAYSERETLMDFISLNLIEYLVKPIDFEDLTYVLERCGKMILDKGLIEFNLSNGASYSFSRKALIVNGKVQTLTPKEIALLELLIKNKNKLVNKEVVEDIVYKNEEMSEFALNNLVSKLRKKVGSKIIRTISNYGFILVKE